MRWGVVCLLFAWITGPSAAQTQDQGPTNGKAQGTYKKALEHEQRHEMAAALDDFKKADKQDGGRCLGCQKSMIRYGLKLQDWKAAETGAEEMVAGAADPKQTAVSHYQYGVVLYREGLSKNKEELFARSHDEISKALAAYPNFPDAVFADGQALAHMKQDDTAKTRFQEFVKMRPEGDLDRQRALRYIAEPELARARMAPPFAITTADGKSLSLDDLHGKVVLLDFWATWCGPCRAALPHMKEIVKKFQGEPLVVVSVSVDDDNSK